MELIDVSLEDLRKYHSVEADNSEKLYKATSFMKSSAIVIRDSEAKLIFHRSAIAAIDKLLAAKSP